MKKTTLICFGIVLLCATNSVSAQDLLAFNEVSTQVSFFESSTLPSPNTDLRRRYGKKRRRGGGDNRFGIGLQVPYNFNKIGVGANLTYQFTDILRFYLGADYYLFALNSGRRFNTINNAEKKGTSFWGTHLDINPNLNFVFGDGDFHFVLISGVYFSVGRHVLSSGAGSILGTALGEDEKVVYIDGEEYFNTDKIPYDGGFGLNLGCGIEYMISDQIRVSLDQQLSLGIMTHWMTHLGVAYCF